MIVSFDSQKKNLGSSGKFFEYLDKENEGKPDDEKEHLFNHDRDDFSPEEATKIIDSNIAKLGKHEEKYFTFHISPSAKERAAINGDTAKMKEYVKDVMEAYAANFNKGLTGSDLVYFAKIERTRNFKNLDTEVQNGFVKQKTPKPGDQLHVHVVVSRKDKTNKIKLSPKDNAKGGSDFKVPGKTRTITRGFNRNAFFDKAEALFDEKFNYDRGVEESYDYRRLKQHHPNQFKVKYGDLDRTNGSKVLSSGNEIINDSEVNKTALVHKPRVPQRFQLYTPPQIKDTDPEFLKVEYIERHVNRAFYRGNSKKNADIDLAQRGIKFNKKGFNFKNTHFKIDRFNLNKEAQDFIKTYYLTRKLGRNLEGKDEDKDKERD